MTTAIVWFRRDLRLSDNPSLHRALERADAVVPVALVPEPSEGTAASYAWRCRSLVALDSALRARGSRLIMREGPAPEALGSLASEVDASLVCCTRAWDPVSLAEEDSVAAHATAMQCGLLVSESQYLVTPRSLLTGGGGAYKVFAPYFHAWSSAAEATTPLPTPQMIPGPQEWPSGIAIPDGGTVDSRWRPGEDGAAKRLERFRSMRLACYDTDRDRPDIDGTSELSPHLACGEVSARQVVDAVRRSMLDEHVTRPFLRQLAWREFAASTLNRFPRLESEPLRPEFAAMPWREDAEMLDAWRAGRTGYPLVDAGMRQLATTGWMHNRVRLVASSFLAKDLLVSWQDGEAHFRRHLVDFDPPQNAFNWQWVAGCGADAAPYFRIFNPVLQGHRFDPQGSYVRRWVPELENLDTRWIHEPFAAPDRELAATGVTLGRTYPRPVVDHAEARQRALAAYESMRARG